MSMLDNKHSRIWIVCLLCFSFLLGCSADIQKQNTESIDNTLVLACWQETPDITELVTLYNSSHADTPVQIHELYNSDVDIDQALQQANAEILAGIDADIYCFGSLDLHAMINAGIAADLLPYAEADPEFTDENYYMDILQMFEENGKLYEMPCAFQLGGICVPAEALPESVDDGLTVEEYTAWDNALKAEGKTILSMAPEDMLAFMVQYSSDDFFSEDFQTCSFDDGQFAQVLTFINDYAEGNGGDPIGMGTWVMGILSYIQDIDMLGTQVKYIGYPDAQRNAPCAMSITSYGISSTSKDPDTSWEFIKTTLSEEAYLNAEMSEGFPLNKAVLAEAIKRFQYSTEDEHSPLYGLTDVHEDYYIPLKEENTAYIYELLDGVTHSALRAKDIYTIITEEGSAYFDGQISADTACERIQTGVSIYLAERSQKW